MDSQQPPVRLLLGLLDLLLPERCAGCGTHGDTWCADCARELGGLRRIERPLLTPGPPVFALGRYRGAARRAVIRYKDNGRRELASAFGKALAVAVRGLALGSCWLVPAPSRVVASRRRGGAHMTRVAEHAAVAASVPVADCLRMRFGVRDSVGLDPEGRMHNLAGRLTTRPERLPTRGAPLVLVDDVITTGATIASCLRALEAVEAQVVAVVSLTATS